MLSLLPALTTPDWIAVMSTLLVWLSLTVTADARDAKNAAKYGWLSNYQTALKQARKTGKPLMVVFRCVP